jgi:hypothetical protein
MKRSEFFKNILGLGLGATMLPQLVKTLSESPVFDEEKEEETLIPPTREANWDKYASISGTTCWTGIDTSMEWGEKFKL